MAKAATFMGPMARKKTVGNHYDPNTYRVISHDAEQIPTFRDEEYAVHSAPLNLLGQPNQVIQERPESEHRHNRPNPNNVNFLRQDVRLLNEPLCNVSTTSTKLEQHRWWPHRESKEPHKQPDHPLDTTVRQDFQYRGKEVKSNTRFSANQNKLPAIGAAPVNFLREADGKQRFWKEKISYEHQYNCRLDPQYPVRSKRHGSFVWNNMPQSEIQKLLQYNDFVADKQSQTQTQNVKPVTVPHETPCEQVMTTVAL